MTYDRAVAVAVPRLFALWEAPLYCLRDSTGAPYAFTGVAHATIPHLELP